MPTLDYSPRSYNLAGMDPPELLLGGQVMIPVLNRRWIPFITGALEVLDQDEYWDDPATQKPQLETLIAGLGKSVFQANFDQLDGLFRPSGCTCLIAPVGGATVQSFSTGYADGARLVAVAAGAAGFKGFSCTMRDIDTNAIPAAVQVLNFATRDTLNGLNFEYTVTVHYFGGAGDGTFTNTTPPTKLQNRELKDFTVTRNTGGFWCVFNMQGPNLL